MKLKSIVRRNPLLASDTEVYINPVTEKKEKEYFKLLDFEGVEPNRYYISTTTRIVDLKEKCYISKEEGPKGIRVRLDTATGGSRLYEIKKLMITCFLKQTTLDKAKARGLVTYFNGDKENNNKYNLIYVNGTELNIFTRWNKGAQTEEDKEKYVRSLLNVGYTVFHIKKSLPYKATTKEIKEIKNKWLHEQKECCCKEETD